MASDTPPAPLSRSPTVKQEHEDPPRSKPQPRNIVAVEFGKPHRTVRPRRDPRGLAIGRRHGVLGIGCADGYYLVAGLVRIIP
jgi:hypothetical protein